MSKILLAGAYGQMGQELIRALSSRIGPHNLVCADVRPPPANINPHIHEELNLMDRGRLFETIEKHKIT
jgi:dihydrodipicolinate reductase